MIHGVLEDDQNIDIFVLPVDINKVTPQTTSRAPYYSLLQAH